MGLLHYLWSRTAASNATADSSVNWAEGQAPSSVNDSARAMMASAAGFRDDIAGAIVTGGTSTAYTVTSYQVFDSLAHMDKMVIAFTPHATSGGTTTLNVDGLGAKPLRSATGVEIFSGTLVAGTPYTCLYNNSDAVFYLHNFYSNPYQVPLGGMMDYIGSSAPNSAFVLPIGQAISRTTYATLFSLVSTTYGVGDGSTTFNVPDLTGRITAMKEASASRLTTAGSGIDGATLGATGGAQNRTLSTGQIPTLTSVNASQSITVTAGGVIPVSSSTWSLVGETGTGGNNVPATGGSLSSQVAAITGINSISVTYTNGSQTAVITAQPTIVVNKILRVL